MPPKKDTVVVSTVKSENKNGEKKVIKKTVDKQSNAKPKQEAKHSGNKNNNKKNGPKPVQKDNALAGAVGAMLANPGDCNVVRIGVLGENQPSMVNKLRTAIDVEQAPYQDGGGSYLIANTGICEVRADPLNHTITSISQTNAMDGAVWFSSLDASGNYVVSAAPLIYANDTKQLGAVQCKYLGGKPACASGDTFYPLTDNGNQYFWYPDNTGITFEFVTQSEINTGYLVSVTVDVNYHTGAEEYSLGSYSATDVAMPLFGEKASSRSHKPVQHTLVRTRFPKSRDAQLDRGINLSKGSGSVPLATRTLTMNFTTFAGGYFSFSPKFTVQNASGAVVSDEAGNPYHAVMTMSWTRDESLTNAYLFMVHQPILDNGKGFELYNAWSFYGLSAQLMNRTPNMSLGGLILCVDIPKYSNWQKLLLEGSDARQLWVNTSTFDPVSLAQSLPPSCYFTNNLADGAYMYRKTDISEVGITKFYDYNEISTAPNATYSPMMNPSKGLLIVFKAPAGGTLTSPALLQLIPSAAYSVTTSDRSLAVDNAYMPYADVVKTLSYFSNPNVKNKMGNPTHTAIIFREILDFMKGTRAVVGQVAGLAGEVLSIANAFSSPFSQSRVGNSGLANQQ